MKIWNNSFNSTADAEAELKSCGVDFVCHAGSPENLSSDSHSHDKPVLLYILEGCLDIRDEETGTNYSLSKGAKVFIPKGGRHSENPASIFRVLFALPIGPTLPEQLIS